MPKLVIALSALLAIGALLGALFAWKAFGWRRSLLALKSGSKDVANIQVYAQDDARLLASGRRPDAVFIGASHTLDWGDLAARFPGSDLVNRGIGGQLVPQYVLRFRQDVLDLRPRAVVIEGCAINATYEVPMRTLADSYRTMAELATLAGIVPVLATMLPVGPPWEAKMPGTNAQVRKMNEMIRALAAEKGYAVVDYYQAIADPQGYLPAADSPDGMHCNPPIYDRMAVALRPVLDAVLHRAGTPAAPVAGTQ
jgi:lysophospholipase L1-like esterase